MILADCADCAAARFLGDQRAERLRRAADRLDAVALQPLGQLGGARRALRRRRELLDHRPRRRGQRHEPDPEDAFVSGDPISATVGTFGVGRSARGWRRRAPLSLPCATCWLAVVGVHLELHLPGQQIGHRRRRAAMDVRDLDAVRRSSNSMVTCGEVPSRPRNS